MRIIIASPFFANEANLSGLSLPAQKIKYAEFCAVLTILRRHQTRISRHGAGSAFDLEEFEWACALNPLAPPPPPVDALLLHGESVFSFQDTFGAPHPTDENAYLARFVFEMQHHRFAALAVGLSVPDPRLVFFWRGSLQESERELRGYRDDQAQFASLIDLAGGV